MQEKDHVAFVQIDPAIKKEADAVLATMRLTASDLCHMAITWVAREKRLPCSIDIHTSDIPNALTRETIEKVDRGEELVRARDAEDLFRKLGI